jgi:hypothetical protein
LKAGISTVIAGLDPAIHLLAKRTDARVKPAQDWAEAAIELPQQEDKTSWRSSL